MIVAGDEKRRRYRDDGWWGDQTLSDLFFANAAQHPDRLGLVDAPNRADFAFGVPPSGNGRIDWLGCSPGGSATTSVSLVVCV
jgi:hypothetical protein